MLQVASDVAIKHAVDCPSAWGSGRSKQGSRHGLWRRLRARSGTARTQRAFMFGKISPLQLKGCRPATVRR